MKRQWTDDRCAELDALRDLLSECRSINNGSSVIERMQRIIEAAEKLSKVNWGKGHKPFTAFLEELAYEDREANLKTT